MNKTRWALLVGAALAAGALLMLAWPDDRDERAEITPEPTHENMGQEDCPPGASTTGSGPEMVRLPEGFCIDTTEVTRAQYDAWLATDPSAAGQPSACSENDSFEPGCDSEGDQPAVCVDWCDARAFCEAAGKRLCGAVGDGDGYSFDQYDDASASEWHAACTSGGTYEYTYGDELNTQTCRGADAEDGEDPIHQNYGRVDVGSLDGCHSPDDNYSAVYDMSGNVAEWDNGCDGEEPDSPCRIRGGSYEHQNHGLRCAMGQNLRWPRMRQQGGVGFRCCAD